MLLTYLVGFDTLIVLGLLLIEGSGNEYNINQVTDTVAVNGTLYLLILLFLVTIYSGKDRRIERT